VIRNDLPGRKFHHSVQTGTVELRTAVKKYRRQMGKEAVAGKQVAAEEQVEAQAVKSAMTLRVSGQMNNAETSQYGKSMPSLMG